MRLFWTNGSRGGFEFSYVSDVTLVDDEAIIVVLDRADQLLELLSTLFPASFCIFRKYVVQVDFAKGERKVSPALRGKDSVAVKSQLAEAIDTDGTRAFNVTIEKDRWGYELSTLTSIWAATFVVTAVLY